MLLFLTIKEKKAEYTATLVTCEWAEAVIKKISYAFGQVQKKYAKTARNCRKNDKNKVWWTDWPTYCQKKLGVESRCTRVKRKNLICEFVGEKMVIKQAFRGVIWILQTNVSSYMNVHFIVSTNGRRTEQGRIHGNPVADGWAGWAMQKPLGIQKCDGPTDLPT